MQQIQTIAELITLVIAGDLKAEKELKKRHKTYTHNYLKHFKNNPNMPELTGMKQQIELIGQYI